ALFPWVVDQCATALSDEQIEYNVHRRCLRRQFRDATRRWMYSLKQRIERQCSALGDDELAIEHELLRAEVAQCRYDFREVARQRLACLRSQFHLRTVSKCDAPKAIPLGLVLPLRPSRQLGHRLRFHRCIAVPGRKSHRRSCSFTRPRAASSGAHRSRSSATRSGTVSIRNASRSTPRSTSSQLTGVDTVARGVGRTEYTDASVFPHAF